MPKFPDPPDLEQLLERCSQPVLNTLPAGTAIFRLHRVEGAYPSQWPEFRYYGPTSSRFDHHLSNENGEGEVQDRGILYGAVGAQAFKTCLAEFFQQTRIVDVSRYKPVMTAFEIVDSLRLVDLSGDFATRIGASAAINSGPRPRAQRWAQLIYDAYPQAQGIFYTSSMNPGQPAVALFERALPAMPDRPRFSRELRHIAYLEAAANAAESLGYQVV